MDNDGDPDELMTFDGIANCSLMKALKNMFAFSDVDGDDYFALLLVGNTNEIAFTRIARLYLNDGYRKFSESIDTSEERFTSSSNALSDIDDDIKTNI